MKKIWTSLFIFLLLISMSFNGLSVSAQSKFPDVAESFWATNEINYLIEKGIINGYPNGKFGPDDSITRLQAVTMILREMGIKEFKNTVDPGFSDMNPDSYGYEIVAKGVELGFINGKKDKEGEKYFDPSGTLTRAEMAKILVYAYGLNGTSKLTFKDVTSSHWAYSVIQTLVKNRITVGYGDGIFGHSDNMTRAQFAVMMARVLDESFLPAEMTTPSIESKYLPLKEAKKILDDSGLFKISVDGTFYMLFTPSEMREVIGIELAENGVAMIRYNHGPYITYGSGTLEQYIEMMGPAEGTLQYEFAMSETDKYKQAVRAAADAVYGKGTPKANALYNEIFEVASKKDNLYHFGRFFN